MCALTRDRDITGHEGKTETTTELVFIHLGMGDGIEKERKVWQQAVLGLSCHVMRAGLLVCYTSIR